MPTTIEQPGGTTVTIRDLSGQIQQSTDLETWNDLFFAATLKNSNPALGTLKIVFMTDITLTSPLQYFICGSDSIEIGSPTLNQDGTRPTIFLNNCDDWNGLVFNGDAGTDGFDNITIQNLVVSALGSTNLFFNAGQIGWTGFTVNATNNLILNCSVDGPINRNNSGGIVGAQCAPVGSLTIRSCTSSGEISGISAGGIVGTNAGYPNGSITIEQCSSTGNISGFDAGGIFGSGAGSSGGTAIATNCQSTGNIQSQAGGIFGSGAAATNGTVTATNCYSTGNINPNGGGIFGASAATVGGTTNATNCQSIGIISDLAGGIQGTTTSPGSIANHCYTSGLAEGSGGGIYTNSQNDNLRGAGNQSEGNNDTSGWNDNHATTYLQGAPITSPYGLTWSQINGPNTPQILSLSGQSPQSIILGTTFTDSLDPGDSTPPAVVPGQTQSILAIQGSPPSSYPTITIDISSGVITTTSFTEGNTYIIIVQSTKNPQSITTYTLIVSGSGPLPIITKETPIQPELCCSRPMDFTNADYRTINEMIIGNTEIGQSNRMYQTAVQTQSFLHQKQMAYAAKR